jgi:hypothetical protein
MEALHGRDVKVLEPRNRLADACERLAAHLERLTWQPLLGCALLIWLSLAASAARPFWFDELITFHLARLPDFTTLWAALSKGVDLQPPLFDLATTAAQKLFGASEAATRLPSLAGYLLMTVCLYWFVRRRTNALYGAIAALFPAVTEAFFYSYEARPYALMLGFSALALLCWQEAAYASTGVQRKLGLVGLWLSLALAISCHYYCVLVFIPIAIGELVRIVQRRRLDIPMALAAVLAGIVGIVYLPLIRGAMVAQSIHPWNSVRLRFLFDGFQSALYPAAVPMAFCFVALWLLHGFRGATNPAATGTRLTWAETGACLGFVALPVFGYLIGRFVTHMMTERYVLSLVVGFAILFACTLYRVTGGRAFPGLVLALILVGTFVARHITRAHATNPYAEQRLPTAHGNLPLVVGSPLDFLPEVHYAGPNVRSRLVYLCNADLAAHYLGQNATEFTLVLGAPFFDWPVRPYADFFREHRRFLLLSNPAANWVQKKLEADGAGMELVSEDLGGALYLVTLR